VGELNRFFFSFCFLVSTPPQAHFFTLSVFFSFDVTEQKL